MLSKLYKHELKALFRYFLIIWCAIVAIAAVNSLMIGIGKLIGMQASGSPAGVKIPETVRKIYSMTLGSFVLIYVLGVMASVVLGLVIVVVRFYRNFFGSEGYFTFTLPFSPMQHLLCKLICALLMLISTFFVVGVSVVIICLPEGIGGEFTEFARQIRNWILPFDYDRGKLIVLVVEIAILGFVLFVSSVLQYYCAMALGQSMMKNKILGAVLAYFSINIIVQIFNTVLNTMFMLDLTSGRTDNIHLMFVPYIILYTLLTAAYFLISHYIIKNKLNLA